MQNNAQLYQCHADNTLHYSKQHRCCIKVACGRFPLANLRTCTAAQAAASACTADAGAACRSAQASMSAASANASPMAAMLKLPDPMSRPGSCSTAGSSGCYTIREQASTDLCTVATVWKEPQSMMKPLTASLQPASECQ